MINRAIKLYKKYEEIVNYIIVGVLTTFVSIATKWILLFTIFSSENAFQLQTSIIISWIFAVTFAYFTNRKYVFKSKCNNILKEISSFYGARIITLLLEMALMWIFVTFLKLNTNIWVMIITISVQFIILILNYVFSKLFVFKKTNDKDNIILENLKKYKIYIIYGIVLLLLCMLAYYFPLSGNDYLLHNENISLKLSNFQFGYIGNYLAIVMINNNILKAIIIGLTIFIMAIMVGKIVNYSDKSISIMFILLLILINPYLLRTTIVNISSFSNYVIPLALVSIYMYSIKKIVINSKYNYIELILLSILAIIIGLFNDYMSIFMVFNNLYIFIYKYIKDKKKDYRILILLIVSILSLVLMINSTDLIYNTKHIRYGGFNKNFITNAVRNYFNIIQNNLLTGSYYINIFVSLCILIIANKNNDKSLSIKLLSFGILIFNLIVIVANVFSFNIEYGIIHYIISMISIMYLFLLFIFIIKMIKKNESNKYVYLLISLISMIIIYSCLSGLRVQAILYLYFIYILLGLELYNYLKKHFDTLVYPNLEGIFIVLVSIIAILIPIYKEIYYYNINRDNIVYKQYTEGKNIVYFPSDNYSNYVYRNYPIGDSMLKNYLKYMKINVNTSKIKYIEKDDIKYKLMFLDGFKYNKLMIVAHPDDELIWGGKELMDNDYVVVCVTCGYDINAKRVIEFKNVMNELNDEYIMLNHTDLQNGFKSSWDREYDDVLNDIKEIINYKNWEKIVVHSPFGESGHIHHKLINKITTSTIDDKSNLYYFTKYYKDETQYPKNTVKISDKYVNRKIKLFKKYYKSQAHVKFAYCYPYERLWSYEDWHKEFDPNYNYN